MPYPNAFGNFPYQMPQANPTVYQPPINGYIQVAGLEGAKSFNMPPNSRAPLFDSNEDIFYDVSTDANGQKTIHPCPFTMTDLEDQANSIFATKEDIRNVNQGLTDLNSKFDKIWEALNGEQSVSPAQ